MVTRLSDPRNALSPSFKQRPVKLFAMSEFGVQRPTPCFVRPLQAGRRLDSPIHP